MSRWLLTVSVLFAVIETNAAGTTLDRPNASAGPTLVTVRLFFNDVFSVSSVDQSYRADFHAVATWHDPRLAGGERRRVMLTDVWHPTLAIVNERNMKDLLPGEVEIDEDGNMRAAHRLSGELSARMDLAAFPYDDQALAVRIVSLGHSPDEVDLRPASELTTAQPEFSATGWSITPGPAYASPLEIDTLRVTLPQVVFELNAARDVAYYRWTMYLPLAFIVLMAWMVFWIDLSIHPSQVALATASVFTLIAFRFSMRLSLPAISYMTAMDSFLVGCQVLVFLALAKAVLTGRLMKQNREPLARRIDSVGRWVYVAGFGALLLAYG